MSEKEEIWSYEFEKGKEIKPGQLLLSEPFMPDENFKRTVVLVCEHTEQNGTIGLIINRPINLKLNEVVSGFPPFNGKVFLGGPVGTDTLQFLHSLDHTIENSLELSPGLFWGGNFEQIKHLMNAGEIQPHEIRFYLGYSGWSPNQLEDEMKENSWIIAPAKSKHIFHSDYNFLWRDVMKEMGGLYSTMANYPENPILN